MSRDIRATFHEDWRINEAFAQEARGLLRRCSHEQSIVMQRLGAGPQVCSRCSVWGEFKKRSSNRTGLSCWWEEGEASGHARGPTGPLVTEGGEGQLSWRFKPCSVAGTKVGRRQPKPDWPGMGDSGHCLQGTDVEPPCLGRYCCLCHCGQKKGSD